MKLSKGARWVLAVLLIALIGTRKEVQSVASTIARRAYLRLGLTGPHFPQMPAGADVVFLIGDAGAMSDGVLVALQNAVRAAPQASAMLYLGDNVYPTGIPKDKQSSEWHVARASLMKQIDPFVGQTERIYFVPGNHDWENHGVDGWGAAQRHTELVDGRLGGGHALPPGGCPGPSRIQLFSDLQLIALDSSWWLHDHRKPSSAADGCEVFSEEGVVAALDSMLASTPTGVETIIALHHPLLPARTNVAHTSCPFSPDCPRYAQMVDKLTRVLSKYRPLLCASGHNHLLQVLKDAGGCRTYVVSGGGSYKYAAPRAHNFAFSESTLGFMILHRDRGSPWTLDVIRTRSDTSLLPPKWELAYQVDVK